MPLATLALVAFAAPQQPEHSHPHPTVRRHDSARPARGDLAAPGQQEPEGEQEPHEHQHPHPTVRRHDPVAGLPGTGTVADLVEFSGVLTGVWQ